MGSRDPAMILFLTYDLPLKVNLKVKGQNYDNHWISPLLFNIEVWNVLHTYRKVGSKNPAIVLVLLYNLPFKVNLKVKGISDFCFKLWIILCTPRNVYCCGHGKPCAVNWVKTSKRIYKNNYLNVDGNIWIFKGPDEYQKNKYLSTGLLCT